MLDTDRLRRLATIVESVPQDRFDMEMIISNLTLVDYEKTPTEVALTYKQACVLGQAFLHSTELGIPEMSYSSFMNNAEALVLGVDGLLNVPDGAWAMMFSGNWTLIDNTPVGAANRIRYFIEHHEDADFCYNACAMTQGVMEVPLVPVPA